MGKLLKIMKTYVTGAIFTVKVSLIVDIFCVFSQYICEISALLSV